MTTRKIEIFVGIFVSLGIIGLVFLALVVSEMNINSQAGTYELNAKFDNIGGLKMRSPIKVGGVVVGRVGKIHLDIEDYTPIVTMIISAEFNQFAETSSVAILTSGLLGEQYIGLEPGFIDEDISILGNGDYIEDTKSALVLENLIGQFLFNSSEEDES